MQANGYGVSKLNELEVSPPHDIAGEEAVIGSLLIDSVSIREIPALMPDDFYHEPCRLLFGFCKQLEEAGTTINQITLANAAKEGGKLKTCGGVAYLSHLVSVTPTSMDIEHYAAIVQKLSGARKLISAGESIVKLGYTGHNLPEALEEADDLILNVRKRHSSSRVLSPEDRAQMMTKVYDQLLAQDEGVTIKTGLFDLDYHLGGGFYPGELIVLGARPGVGKTTLLSTIINHVSLASNVLFCTAEMDTISVTHRDIASLTGLSFQKIRYGGYDDDTYLKITRAVMEEIPKQRVYILDRAPMTTAMIHEAALALQVRKGLSLVVVDYLGLLDDTSKDNQNMRLDSMTRNLKTIAKSLSVPVLVVHQLNRGVELRDKDNRRPRLSDLRESGHIEENADIVMFMYRESYYDNESDSKITELILPKIRMGDEQNITIRVLFDEKYKRYVNLVRQEES